MTDFLFAIPSFVSGMGQAFDIGGTMLVFNESASPEEADELAIFNDCVVVGNEIREAARKVCP